MFFKCENICLARILKKILLDLRNTLKLCKFCLKDPDILKIFHIHAIHYYKHITFLFFYFILTKMASVQPEDFGKFSECSDWNMYG